MLTHLHIHHFTIIEQLALDFNSGMTVFTGETGAGKSILIDALQLALGARTESSLAVRHGSERCEISASFDLRTIPLAQAFLSEHDFASEDECILRRIITKDGRSRGSINGRPAALQLMRELGALLINVHGQHEHHALLKRDEQRTLLDQSAHHPALLLAVKNAYHDVQKAQIELTRLKTLAEKSTAQIELLRYHLAEFEQLALGEGEWIALEKEYKQLTNVEELLTHCQTAWQATAGDENINALHLLTTASHTLESLSKLDENITNIGQSLTAALIQVNDAARELRHYLDHLEINPERVQFVEQRLQALHDLARKHRVTPAELTSLHDNIRNELQTLDHAEQTFSNRETHLAELKKTYLSAAAALSKSRIAAAKKLSKKITASMQQLGMPGGYFDIVFEQITSPIFSPDGTDHLTFQVSTNPGQPLQALHKIVSGGELSRISLAIQVITAQADATPTLIFDEVDVGIGGGTAAIVGKLLRALGSQTQVLCVTHLPQVASQGHHHLKISKSISHDTAMTEVCALDQKERIQEIARMLGGLTLTENTVAHARDLLDQNL